MSDIDKINSYFSQFMKEVKLINNNVILEKEFTRGYLACMNDIIKEVVSDDLEKESELMKMIKDNIDMSSREKIIGEIMVGLDNLYSAYSKISKDS